MAEDYGTCNLCKNGRMVKKEEREISGTVYLILKCDKCKYQVARSVR